jgi:hypothetical protein
MNLVASGFHECRSLSSVRFESESRLSRSKEKALIESRTQDSFKNKPGIKHFHALESGHPKNVIHTLSALSTLLSSMLTNKPSSIIIQQIFEKFIVFVPAEFSLRELSSVMKSFIMIMILQFLLTRNSC